MTLPIIIKKSIIVTLYSVLATVFVTSLISLTNKKEMYLEKKHSIEMMLKTELNLDKIIKK